MTDIAIVITCYNQSAYTRQAIESLLRTTADVDDYRFEFAVFDDCSTGDTRDVVRATGGDRVGYWRSPENSGVTYLWNAAYRRFSHCDHLAIVNNDLIFTPDWCTRILGAMKQIKCDLAGPITNAPGHVPEQDVRRFIGDYEPSDDWADVLRTAEQLEPLDPIPAKKINGFCIVFDTAFLKRAQRHRPGEPFDPKFRNLGNEDEIQDRLKASSLIVPSSFVFHYKRISIKNRFGKFDIESQLFRGSRLPNTAENG
jgi:glycosyltransferase involved in cell wall biosynthesis